MSESKRPERNDTFSIGITFEEINEILMKNPSKNKEAYDRLTPIVEQKRKAFIAQLKSKISQKTVLDKMKDWQAPSKPIVVPRCVAEWFRGLSYNNLEKYILNDVRKMNEKEVYLFTDFEKWFITSENPIETILKMKDGYEVEEK